MKNNFRIFYSRVVRSNTTITVGTILIAVEENHVLHKKLVKNWGKKPVFEGEILQTSCDGDNFIVKIGHQKIREDYFEEWVDFLNTLNRIGSKLN